ncbi:MAG: hypothetical protein OHK0048_23640 [Rhodoferax sp.]
MADVAMAWAVLLGLTPVAWVGWGLIGSSLSGVLISSLIGLGFVVGWLELRRYRRDTRELAQVLNALPAQGLPSAQLLNQVPAALRVWVARRIEGDDVAPPAPALVPYLLGLLVMLGMLGTFVGLVVTLGGVAQSLQTSVELQAIRAALAMPIQGLSLAFGTSVAGVCSSAVLGGLSALSRRARARVAQALDAALLNGPLRPLSRAHQRAQAEQAQAQALPELVAHLRAWAQDQASHQDQWARQWSAQQQAFLAQNQEQFEALARRLDERVHQRLDHGLDALAQRVEPLLQRSVVALGEQVRTLHVQLAQEAKETALQGLIEQGKALQKVQQHWTQSLSQTQAELRAHWQADAAQALAQQEAVLARLDAAVTGMVDGLARLRCDEQQRAEAAAAQWGTLREVTQAGLQALQDQSAQALRELQSTALQAVVDAQARHAAQWAQWLDDARVQSEAAQQAQAQRWAELQSALCQEGQRLHGDAAQQIQVLLSTAQQQLAALQERVAHQLAALGQTVTQPLAALVQALDEVAQRSSALMQRLDQWAQVLQSRDQQQWQRSQEALDAFDAMVRGWEQAAQAQQAHTRAMLAQAERAMGEHTVDLQQQVRSAAQLLDGSRADLAQGAADVSSLRAALEQAAQTFAQASAQTVEHLQQLQAALAQQWARSDDQLAYYVAQAREVIDLSMMSQQAVFEELRALRAGGAAGASQVAVPPLEGAAP